MSFSSVGRVSRYVRSADFAVTRGLEGGSIEARKLEVAATNSEKIEPVQRSGSSA